MPQTYTIEREARYNPFISTHRIQPLLLIRDERRWKKFGDEDLRGYFGDAYRAFALDLLEFQNIEKPLTTETEARLRERLEALIQAKKVWQEECGDTMVDVQ